MGLAVEFGRLISSVEALTVDARKAIHKQHALEPGFTPGRGKGLEITEVVSSEESGLGEEMLDGVFNSSVAQACPPCTVSPSGLAAFLFKGHALIAASVAGTSRAIIFCSTCGAFTETRAKTLRFECGGRSAPGLETQRWLLAQRKFPQDTFYQRVYLFAPMS